MVDSDSLGSGDDEGSECRRARKRVRTRSSAGASGGGARGGGISLDANDRGVSAGTGSVCKLFVKKVRANYSDPWRKSSQQAATGTGFLIQGRWIVTNAHVVHRAVSVLVRATTGPPVKYNAHVAAIGLPCDLAVLTVDGNFWEGKEILQVSHELPRLDDNVTCIGFPVGGENISVTRGVVSRIDVGNSGLLRVQIDAAINPGNSGGPVLGSNGRVVGVAASHLKHASNIGYIIPTSVLEQFLECARAVSNGSCPYIGVASLGLGRVQTLESPALRKVLGLPEGSTGGVRVASVWPLGPSAGLIQENDVLMALDGIEIGQDRTVPLRDNERINFLHLVTQKLAGRDVLTATVLRGGTQIEVKIPLQPDRWLVPRIDGYDAAPEYTIVGGLVFVPLSQPWAELKGNDESSSVAARTLLIQHFGEALPAAGRQVVVLSRVLAHSCNFGYHSLGNVVLHMFNRVPVHNLAQLAELVEACTSDFYEFEFLRSTGVGMDLVVLDKTECMEAERQVLAQHLIATPSMVRPDGQGEPRQPLRQQHAQSLAGASAEIASGAGADDEAKSCDRALEVS